MNWIWFVNTIIISNMSMATHDTDEHTSQKSIAEVEELYTRSLSTQEEASRSDEASTDHYATRVVSVDQSVRWNR